MRRGWWSGVAGAVGVAVSVAVAPPLARAEPAPTAPWVVTVAPGTDIEALGGTVIGPRDVVVDASASDAADLRRRPDVLAVERDAPAVAAALPPETCFLGIACPGSGDQGAMLRIGAAAAWDVVSAAPGVVVAIVDAGVDVAHPDLVGRVTAVPGGAGACAGLDPALGTADRTASGHGTRVAGIIAAAGDGRGVAGVAWAGVQVRSYTALGPDLRGTTAAVAAAIHCAIDDGADVVNLSLTAGDTTAMRNALDRAAAAGVVVVAAAGNGGDGADPGPYPAAHPSVLAVTAVANGAGDERRAAFANGGAWVDLAAPGIGILSTTPGGRYSVADGTSYAVPFVSGAAALVLARDPSLTPAAVRAILESTAEPLADPTTGRGLVDLAAAVRAPAPSSPPCPAPTAAGWVLDAYGALHAFGAAPPVVTAGYWPDRDLARDVATATGVAGGYVLDGWGALHAFGGAPPLVSPGYQPGWDVARGTDRRPDGSVVVVDGQGGLNIAGDGPRLGPGGPWWPGADVARDVVVDPTDPTRAFVLDAFGGVHVAGAGNDPPAIVASRYTPGRDLARRLIVLPGGRGGYVVDAAGRLHAWAIAGTPLPPVRTAASSSEGGRAAFLDVLGAVNVVGASGAVIPTTPVPCRPTPLWPGRDLVRGVALLP